MALTRAMLRGAVRKGWIAAAASLVAGSALADEAGYMAPPLCPDAPSFWASVEERMGGTAADRASDRAQAIGLRITITATAAAFQGEVQRGPAAPRRLAARSCDDLVRALALVTAMTLEAEPPAPILSQLPKARAEPPPKRAAKAAKIPEAAVSIGANVALAFGVVPGNGLGLPVFAEVRWKNGIRARAVYQRAAGDATGLAIGAASFTYNVGRLELCPVELAIGPVDVVPCVSGEAGAIHASPSAVSSAQPSDQVWGAAGGLLRARYLVAAPMFLEGNAAFFVPLSRTRYVFGPGVEVFTTPPVAAGFGLGAGVVFW